MHKYVCMNILKKKLSLFYYILGDLSLRRSMVARGRNKKNDYIVNDYQIHIHFLIWIFSSSIFHVNWLFFLPTSVFTIHIPICVCVCVCLGVCVCVVEDFTTLTKIVTFTFRQIIIRPKWPRLSGVKKKKKHHSAHI